MTGEIPHVSARQLKAQLHDSGEIALLDAREEGVFHARHLLLASCVPLGRLELLIDDLVPRHSTRVVWCDDEDGSARRAAHRMGGLGYTDVALLDGGIEPPGRLPDIASIAAYTCRARRSRKSSSTRPGRRGFPLLI